MTCKNCYHHDACNGWINHGETLYSDYTYSTEDCPFYKDKSRIVELPVSVGQQVWFVRNGKIEETIVEKVVLKHRGLHIKLGCNAMYETSCNSIGKTVFLTREEAEEYLKEVQK